MAMSDLLKRLRMVESGDKWDSGDGSHVTNWYRNPDGPEAADEIEKLRAVAEAALEFVLACKNRRTWDVGDENRRPSEPKHAAYKKMVGAIRVWDNRNDFFIHPHDDSGYAVLPGDDDD